MTHSVLSVNNLSLSLNSGEEKTKLVKKISFSIQPQQIMGLIGESGCGKSLTCLAVMGLLPKNITQVGGEITVGQDVLSNLTQSEIRSLRGSKVAMILQNPMSCFDSVFKIKHHFKETLASKKNGDQKKFMDISRAALIEVGFENPDEILDLYPFQMSGGMLQRVMVSLALVMNASLLIADEPTTDLDVVSQARILDLLARMRRRHGISILLITHDLSVIARLADHVSVMTKGSIVESADVETIFNQPVHDYTKALLNAHFSLYGPKLTRLLGFSSGHVTSFQSIAN